MHITELLSEKRSCPFHGTGARIVLHLYAILGPMIYLVCFIFIRSVGRSYCDDAFSRLGSRHSLNAEIMIKKLLSR